MYEKFEEDPKYSTGRACQESDVVVKIGNQSCNVPSLSRQQLTCRPPSSQPLAVLDEHGHPTQDAYPEVVVSRVETQRQAIALSCISSLVIL